MKADFILVGSGKHNPTLTADGLTIERNALFKAAVQDSEKTVKTNHKKGGKQ